MTGKLKNDENIIKALLDFFWSFVVVLELDTVMLIIMKNICVNSFQNLCLCSTEKIKTWGWINNDQILILSELAL